MSVQLWYGYSLSKDEYGTYFPSASYVDENGDISIHQYKIVKDTLMQLKTRYNIDRNVMVYIFHLSIGWCFPSRSFGTEGLIDPYANGMPAVKYIDCFPCLYPGSEHITHAEVDFENSGDCKDIIVGVKLKETEYHYQGAFTFDPNELLSNEKVQSLNEYMRKHYPKLHIIPKRLIIFGDAQR